MSKEKETIRKPSYAKLIEKAKRLKALADRGEGGEKTNAEMFYREFIAKYNIDEGDINPKHYNRVFKLKSRDYEVLLSHVILAVNPFATIDDEKKGQYGVVLDDEDYLEVTERTNFFYEAFEREKQVFFIAFMEKFTNNFIADEYAVKKHSEVAKKMAEEAERLYKKQSADFSVAKKESQKSEFDPSSRPSKEELDASIVEYRPPPMTQRTLSKIELYKKAIDMIKYIKANRRLGDGLPKETKKKKQSEKQ